MTENQLYCRAQLPQQMIMVLEAMGINKKKLYEELGRDYDQVSPDELLPCDVGKRLWTVATRYIPEDVISFRIMEYFSMAAFGVAGYVIVNSPTGLRAYENFVRYNTLTSNIINFELRLGKTMDLHMILNKKYEPEDRFEIEMNIIGFITFTRSLTANHILPEAVYMQYNKPADISPYQAMLPNVPFYFAAGENRLVYPKELATMKLVGANAQLYETFDSMAEEALKAHQSEGSFSHQVRSELTRRIKSGMPTIDEVARKLNLSERSLQLKLKAENTSFRELSDEVRKDMAIHHLRMGILNISEIAYLLGFSEVSSFSSAFKKWTGAAPSLYAVTA